jgi:hypothetical protein
MLTLGDGTFFHLVADAIPWGRASGPAGLARDTQDLPARGVLVSTSICNIAAGLSSAARTNPALSAFGAP